MLNLLLWMSMLWAAGAQAEGENPEHKVQLSTGTASTRRDPRNDPSIDWSAPVEFKDNTEELNDYIKSYREAAVGGMPLAQYNLGAAYRWGVGVPRDLTEAVRWIRLAADNGYAPAERALGNLYEKGEGVPASEEEAIAWYKRAARQGDTFAQKDLEALQMRISRTATPLEGPLPKR